MGADLPSRPRPRRDLARRLGIVAFPAKGLQVRLGILAATVHGYDVIQLNGCRGAALGGARAAKRFPVQHASAAPLQRAPA